MDGTREEAEQRDLVPESKDVAVDMDEDGMPPVERTARTNMDETARPVDSENQSVDVNNDEKLQSTVLTSEIDEQGTPCGNGGNVAESVAASVYQPLGDRTTDLDHVAEVPTNVSVEPPRKRLRRNSESEHDTSSEEEDEKAPQAPVDSTNYSYENDTYSYTDPSGQKLLWDTTTNSWVAKESKDYVFDGETYLYKDDSGKAYRFDQVQNTWNQVDDEVYEMASKLESKPEKPEHGATYKDPNDGTVYEWDAVKGAWFPKIDDDFLAQYQMSYGVSEEREKEATEEEKKAEVTPEPKPPEKKAPKPPSWFEVDDAHNTKVYVSNLPLEMTEEGFVTLMSRYGLIAKELNSPKWKIKMYKDSEGNFKGDALCDFIKVESVSLALQLLDGSVIDGKTIHVERAKFQMKGDYDPSKKPKKKKKKDLESMKKKQEKLFEWKPDALRGERQKHESVVVIKRLFKPEDIDSKPELLLQLQELLRKECSKFGQVRRVEVHDRHPDGVAQVYFKDAESADDCVMYMHGRWLNQSKIAVETWDGKTKYKIKESEEDRKARLAKWNQFLEKSGEPVE